ncbi:MAG: pyruvate dehydrogenase (acetyl-transferring) E1 component subunit alpha [Deltaproteobacteria bacterium]|nr:pyruvate dehydrogenase (acetyl-transferring) E1 component subunit alpha [Deltaproteobacteria bacterium]
MPRRILESFEVSNLSILDPEGRADPQLEPSLPTAKLKQIFEDMLLLREFDVRAIAMQRQGRMGTYAPSTGQEAVQIAAGAALNPTDWVVPSFREQGLLLSRGVKASTMFLFFMGSEEGNRLPRKLRSLPYCVPCATQVLHAVGIGMAAKLKKDPVAVATFFGDGATSEGDFHEALNFAAVYQSPNVFLCQNNQWAISTPRSAQTRSATLAQKAIAYGFSGLQVDGNDVLAVYSAVDAAAKRAREGGGPSLLECMTYRLGVHTTSDDPGRYRPATELEAWIPKDPIDRFEKYLLAKGLLQSDDRARLTAEIGDRLKAAATEAEEICRNLTPDEMFTYMYADIPDFLRPQREEVLAQSIAIDGDGRAHG